MLDLTGADLEELARFHASAHVLGQRHRQGVIDAGHSAAALDIGHAEGDVVQCQLCERLTAQQLVGLERAHQHVALERQSAVQIGVSAGGAGQPMQIHRRFEIAPVAPAFEVVEDAARVQHGRGVAEGERLNAGRGGHGSALVGVSHQQISMVLRAAVPPSSGSFCSACMSAHARSAWPVVRERPAV